MENLLDNKRIRRHIFNMIMSPFHIMTNNNIVNMIISTILCITIRIDNYNNIVTLCIIGIVFEKIYNIILSIICIYLFCRDKQIDFIFPTYISIIVMFGSLPFNIYLSSIYMVSCPVYENVCDLITGLLVLNYCKYFTLCVLYTWYLIDVYRKKS